MNQQVTRRQDSQLQKVSPKELITQKTKMILAALPGSETAKNRFYQAMMGVASQPSIQQCEATSVVRAVYQCARLNLIPDPVLHHVAIVPFKNHGVKEATMIVEYRGLIELMKRANPSLTIKAGTVYENDDYELIEGTTETLKITKRAFEKKLGKGAAVFHYAVVTEPGANPIMVILGADEAKEIGRKSKAGSKPGTPWFEHPDRMGEKTCVKRMERFVRMDPEKEETKQFREAIEWDERSDEAVDVGDDTDIMGAMSGDGDPEEDPVDLSEGKSPIGRAEKKKGARGAAGKSNRSKPEAALESSTAPTAEPSPASTTEPPDDGPPTPVDMKKLGGMIDLALDKGGVQINNDSRFLMAKHAAEVDPNIDESAWAEHLKKATRGDVKKWRDRLAEASVATIHSVFAFDKEPEPRPDPEAISPMGKIITSWAAKRGISLEEATAAATKMLDLKYELTPEQLADQGAMADDIARDIENDVIGVERLSRYE